MGIIGRNGAGKSTLLKILSQISEPTTGEIRVRGRLAALLEVGAGFHPELTGRENVFLNGSILGMSRAEIRKKFDEIVAFSEVEKFLDTPVKRYSSGMHVRLAFAVAAHLEADILVVDEVLAVGDAAFQAKCMQRMGDITTSGGRTILFVSHNLAAVQRLCSRGLYLEGGRLKADGPITAVLDAYQRSFESGGSGDTSALEVPEGTARIASWRLIDSGTENPHSCMTREVCIFEFKLVSRFNALSVGASFILWNLDGALVVAGSLRESRIANFPLTSGIFRIRVKVRLPIKAGLYQVEMRVYDEAGSSIDSALLEPKLHVLPAESTLEPQWQGLITEPLTFEIEAPPARPAPDIALPVKAD